ncbi:MAG: GNAT family N-acetyltransferase [Deltaproteobacteria bacterium]|jgi:acyl-CoA hydrolase/RimJ/RimL family protein N-acetyltransferase|nr:GNAT family N-acetyltransferase [Deltaproteobacteria bacterium]MBT4264025.1 GNAT family N-acetyltransferase [Deltaproteobacteria bacterium]MBT4640625.1 GNAT family N-acetyltransferase [Deltaproteobacteria bacterium]MBT6505052.1 GNAT family N-acetyltransferase [Deltaproteobacteria bacterium]MBT6612974.1 GNAT family N-acetyltransferase [Deltaproteobacteria bacterium]
MANELESKSWEDTVVSPDLVMDKIRPGMSIFVGTGPAEPRTLVKKLISSESYNLQDLQLIQLVSVGDAISQKELRYQRYRLKTFFSGWIADEASTAGRVDLIPSRFDNIPRLIESRQLPIDVAFVQITPPNEAGYCSLGVAVDVARLAMEQASLVVGEINTQIPRTFGDTFVPASEFDFLVKSTEPPIYFDPWPMDEIFDKVAENVANIIEDGSCIAFSIGTLFEHLSLHLMKKRDLGVHTPFFSDNMMNLVKSGAVSNRRKEINRGQSVTSYAYGSPQLMEWLDRNPMVEFQGIDKVFNPLQIGKNNNFVAVTQARKVDLAGRVTLHVSGKGVVTGLAQATAVVNGASLSKGGYTIFGLPSRNIKGESNILMNVENLPNQMNIPETVNLIATEYGVANLNGRTLRERAQALIEIAHPEDRKMLIDEAKAAKILYQDQIFLENASLYPTEITTKKEFKNGLEVRFRAIKPSDEEEMRHLFYRFSDEAVYYRYFTSIKTMPHTKMQEYVNVDYNQVMSIVGLIYEPGQGTIIAEARFVREPRRPWADVAFIVDEKVSGLGIASYLYQMLIRLGKERGLQGFTADVLSSNQGMMKVFEKGGLVKAKLEYGVYKLTMPFD